MSKTEAMIKAEPYPDGEVHSGDYHLLPPEDQREG